MWTKNWLETPLGLEFDSKTSTSHPVKRLKQNVCYNATVLLSKTATTLLAPDLLKAFTALPYITVKNICSQIRRSETILTNSKKVIFLGKISKFFEVFQIFY